MHKNVFQLLYRNYIHFVIFMLLRMNPKSLKSLWDHWVAMLVPKRMPSWKNWPWLVEILHKIFKMKRMKNVIHFIFPEICHPPCHYHHHPDLIQMLDPFTGINISHENWFFSGIDSKISKLFRIYKKKIWRLIIVGFHCFHKFFILSQKQMWWTCNIMPKIYSFINRMNYWAKKNEEIRILKKFLQKYQCFCTKLDKIFPKNL